MGDDCQTHCFNPARMAIWPYPSWTFNPYCTLERDYCGREWSPVCTWEVSSVSPQFGLQSNDLYLPPAAQQGSLRVATVAALLARHRSRPCKTCSYFSTVQATGRPNASSPGSCRRCTVGYPIRENPLAVHLTPHYCRIVGDSCYGILHLLRAEYTLVVYYSNHPSHFLILRLASTKTGDSRPACERWPRSHLLSSVRSFSSLAERSLQLR